MLPILSLKNWDVLNNHLGRVLLGPTGLGWLGWLGFSTCSIGNQPFSVCLVDQLFQPTRNPVELVENDGYRPLSQSWALIRCVMSTNAILFKMVGVWCPLSPRRRPCFPLSTKNGWNASYRPLSWYSCSANVWSNTWIKHTTAKNKPSLVSAPIFRVTNQSTVKCHHFENCNFYKDLYGERARHARSAPLPYKTL